LALSPRRACSQETSQYPGVLTGLQEEEEYGAGVSAAASGEAGPPPVAVALVSSLFTSEQHPSERLQQQQAGTHVSTKSTFVQQPAHGRCAADPSSTLYDPMLSGASSAATSPSPYLKSGQYGGGKAAVQSPPVFLKYNLNKGNSLAAKQAAAAQERVYMTTSALNNVQPPLSAAAADVRQTCSAEQDRSDLMQHGEYGMYMGRHRPAKFGDRADEDSG
jgi:hypothetical protein